MKNTRVQTHTAAYSYRILIDVCLYTISCHIVHCVSGVTHCVVDFIAQNSIIYSINLSLVCSQILRRAPSTVVFRRISIHQKDDILNPRAHCNMLSTVKQTIHKSQSVGDEDRRTCEGMTSITGQHSHVLAAFEIAN